MDLRPEISVLKIHSDFIGLCDSDDKWNSDKVYKEMRLINSSKKI